MCDRCQAQIKYSKSGGDSSYNTLWMYWFRYHSLPLTDSEFQDRGYPVPLAFLEAQRVHHCLLNERCNPYTSSAPPPHPAHPGIQGPLVTGNHETIVSNGVTLASCHFSLSLGFLIQKIKRWGGRDST